MATRAICERSERDCPVCQPAQGKAKPAKPEIPLAWGMRKGRGGRKKQISTAGYFCPNLDCEYFEILDERNHALVGYGIHGQKEIIQDLKC